MVNMWAITHDPTKPERFTDKEDILIMGSDLRLAPFGFVQEGFVKYLQKLMRIKRQACDDFENCDSPSKK
ncbi:hypothetical protein RND71_003320 [Anisodus tanguticus]|uniref:Uncharacterized protein n=1 Tax=Anisodus tanguticus TaxID=243964 RepID=A0AAE1SUD2_9SOLA|nr:hypothetical protein RND71_003320 [Anisodus tanguticus]